MVDAHLAAIDLDFNSGVCWHIKRFAFERPTKIIEDLGPIEWLRLGAL
jgi:hypothetical protein